MNVVQRPSPRGAWRCPSGTTAVSAAASAEMRLERHDDRHADVQQQADPAEEDRQEEEYPDEARVEVEVLGHAPGDAGEDPVVAATIQTAVHAASSDRIDLDGTEVERTVRSARCVADA